jgi:hypothetical protein
MKKALDVRFILIAISVGVLLLGARDICLRFTGLKRARAHANAAFQGEPVEADISCLGFWRQKLSPSDHFEVYMESSNGRGMFFDWTYVAVKTSEERRYERIERFDYYKARAYGDTDKDFWHNAKSRDEKASFLEQRLETFQNHPEVTNIFRIRLVNSLAEFDTVLTKLGFTKQ